MLTKPTHKRFSFKKVSTSLVVLASLLVVQAPFAEQANAAEATKEKRPTQLVGQSVGKKVAKAFEAYTADDIDGALVILKEIDAKEGSYDEAYVSRFIAVMYATKGDHEEEAIKYLKKAVEPDILNEGDHGEALKLLGDLLMQTKDYKGALSNYYAWMDVYW